MGMDPSNDDAFEQALSSVAPDVRDALRDLTVDASYVEPRVVTHLRD